MVDAKGSISGEILTKGEWADFDIDLWHELTQKNAGGKISVSVTAKKDGKWFGYEPFEIFVSTDNGTNRNDSKEET